MRYSVRWIGWLCGDFNKGRKMIIKYKTFSNSAEFESFQENNNVQIFNIIPVAINAGVTFKEKESGGFNMGYDVFVTYQDLAT